MNRKKQFIAGATCPQCSNIDSLVLYADDQSIACVECDFNQSSEQRDSKLSTDETKTDISYKNVDSIKITNLSD